MTQPLTQYEIEVLLEKCPRELRPDLLRLLDELRTLRDQQAQREFHYGLEPDV